MRRAAAAVTLAALATGLAGTAAAQDPDPDDLTGLLDTLAILWTRGDAAGLAAHAAVAGLDLEVDGTSMGHLEGRRAAAAFRQLFGRQETVAVEAGHAAKVIGAEDRAFSEFIWVIRMPGAAMTETHKIFVALVLESREWRVSQIRILR